MNVACIGMGWWSDVLADAIMRSGRMKIAACYSRSRDKREAFARKYACTAASSYEEILGDRRIEAIINTTPNSAHLETTCAAAASGKHVFLDKPIANTIDDARAITAACRQAKVVLALGYQRRRESQFRWIKQNLDSFGKLVNAEANISRDRLGKIDLSWWRYTAEGMPGGVMLPGDNPDVASLVLEHENGALSTLNASYASASEYYLMNIYGKEASAYYDMHQGLRWLKRGSDKAEPVAVQKNDPIVDELEEFADAVRGDGQPEMDGERSTRSLAVLLAGIQSAREGRRVEIQEVLK
jgi:predicted dehydrogenase